MMRVALTVLALAAVCDGILPEIVDSGIGHILQEDSDLRGQTEPERVFAEVKPQPEAPQQKTPEDAAQQESTDLPPHHQNQTVPDGDSVHTSEEQETDITVVLQPSDLENNIDHGCSTNEDCGKDKYCLSDAHSSKCLSCKAVDVSCRMDEECCGEQLCVWGQCTQNATKGGAGSTCQYQRDCSPELCCALHKALLFSVCSAKPIERERCFGASNHLIALLSWDVQDEGPRKHCPCVGDLHCQHLGRGSMCLKGEDSSEEDLTDTLYSEIDYII